MPDFTIEWRNKKTYVELDNEGMVLDLDDGTGRYISENEKITFEIDHHERILDVMAEYQREMSEHKKARGRDRCEE